MTKAKILVYFLFSAHNIPFAAADKVVGYYQEQFLDSAIAQNIILSAKKILYAYL